MTIDSLRQKLAPEFEEIRNREAFSPYEMVTWLAENMNTIWAEVGSRHTKQFDPHTLSSNMTVEVIRGYPHVVVRGEWNYSDWSGRHPKLSMLSDLMPKVNVRPGKKSKYRISADLVFNLADWPCFLLPTLYHKAKFALLQVYGDPALREEALRETLTLAQHYFPTLTLDVLHMAIELDLFVSLDTFKALCLPHGKLQADVDVLPGDFTY